MTRNEIVSRVRVTLSGTFRKDPGGLRDTFTHLRDLGCFVVSPDNVEVVSERDGFVFMRGEANLAPEAIERRHLEAIQSSHFVWLHAPDGYVGTSASLEVGFASAAGVPVFSSEHPQDATIAQFVTVVRSPSQAVGMLATEPPRPPNSLPAFQEYYRRVAVQRGYATESARDTLLLLTEEIGELARCIRKTAGLVRHSSGPVADPGLELADVFLYVVHLANVLGFDLASFLRQKEEINHRRFVNSLSDHG